MSPAEHSHLNRDKGWRKRCRRDDGDVAFHVVFPSRWTPTWTDKFAIWNSKFHTGETDGWCAHDLRMMSITCSSHRVVRAVIEDGDAHSIHLSRSNNVFTELCSRRARWASIHERLHLNLSDTEVQGHHMYLGRG